MNKELAIECIKTQRQFVDDMTCEAFDMAIDLIKENNAPVRHGRWYKNDQDKLLMRIRCSICNKAIYSENHFAYCPNCGARMDGEE